ncbi:hypothetical protein D3C73_1534430 [compost metagenome]
MRNNFNLWIGLLKCSERTNMIYIVMGHDQFGDGIQTDVMTAGCFFKKWNKVRITAINKNRILFIFKDGRSNC